MIDLKETQILEMVFKLRLLKAMGIFDIVLGQFKNLPVFSLVFCEVCDPNARLQLQNLLETRLPWVCGNNITYHHVRMLKVLLVKVFPRQPRLSRCLTELILLSTYKVVESSFHLPYLCRE
jgi:hypothetical protein